MCDVSVVADTVEAVNGLRLDGKQFVDVLDGRMKRDTNC